MALLSIIVPVFNKEQFIDSCYESIVAQTFTDFELIFINDGSTDGCGDRCDYYGEADSRVVVIHQENQGVSAARNAGLAVAKGKYIGFVDSDDLLDADMYETLINTLTDEAADIAMCGVRKVFPDKEELYFGTNTLKVYDKNEAISAFFKKEFSLSVYDKLFKAEIAQSIKFEGAIYEDIFYCFRALIKADTIAFNDVIKYHYIIRDNSMSMSSFNKKYMDSVNFSKQMVEICRRELPDLVDEAMYFDLVANISLLNILLLGNKKQHKDEYQTVINNLKPYAGFVENAIVSKKHSYAYRIFMISPQFYAFAMKKYCQLFDTEALKRI